MFNKKYAITALVLGLVAATSALLIGLTHLATKAKIEENERLAISEGMNEIYAKTSTNYVEIKSFKGYETVKKAYKVSENDQFLGYAFKTAGSNTYGKISLIVGFAPGSGVKYYFAGISVIENGQTYASTLEENYIDPLHNNTITYDQVNCGATYGAKLIEKMINDANNAAEQVWGINE